MIRHYSLLYSTPLAPRRPKWVTLLGRLYMYVCIYIYIQTFFSDIRLFLSRYSYVLFRASLCEGGYVIGRLICIYVCIHGCIYMCIYICIHIYVHVYIHMCMDICISVYAKSSEVSPYSTRPFSAHRLKLAMGWLRLVGSFKF